MPARHLDLYKAMGYNPCVSILYNLPSLPMGSASPKGQVGHLNRAGDHHRRPARECLADSRLFDQEEEQYGMQCDNGHDSV